MPWAPCPANIDSPGVANTCKYNTYIIEKRQRVSASMIYAQLRRKDATSELRLYLSPSPSPSPSPLTLTLTSHPHPHLHPHLHPHPHPHLSPSPLIIARTPHIVRCGLPPLPASASIARLLCLRLALPSPLTCPLNCNSQLPNSHLSSPTSHLSPSTSHLPPPHQSCNPPRPSPHLFVRRWRNPPASTRQCPLRLRWRRRHRCGKAQRLPSQRPRQVYSITCSRANMRARVQRWHWRVSWERGGRQGAGLVQQS